MNDRGNLGYFQFPLFYLEVSKQHLPVNDTNDFFARYAGHWILFRSPFKPNC